MDLSLKENKYDNEFLNEKLCPEGTIGNSLLFAVYLRHHRGGHRKVAHAY